MKYLFSCFTLLLLFISACTAQKTSENDFNIVLITIDALRADHLSCYGYERETSPNIDRIAEKGIVFKNVIAPSSWTAPSMVSLFTSVYPLNHEVVHGFMPRSRKNIYQQDAFSDKLTTLTEILKSHDYTTFGISSNHNLTRGTGFARGFDYFQYENFIPADRANEIVYSWENAIKKSEKYFLWVHYYDPHHPYHARFPWIKDYTSEELIYQLDLTNKTWKELWALVPTLKKDPEARACLVALYDSEINYVDLYVGKLTQKLNLDNNTLIIITSDHGEEFLEHRFIGHGHNLYQESVNIPLVIKVPSSSEKKVIEKHVNLVDIMPTILDALNINPPLQTEGKSLWTKNKLFPQLRNMLLGNERNEQHSFTELGRKFDLKAIVTPEWKYIYDYKNKKEQLYNIKDDSKELSNLARKASKKRDELKSILFKWVSHSKKYPLKRQTIQLSKEEEERLMAMGYLDTQIPGQKQSQERLVTKKGRKDERKTKGSTIVGSKKASLKIVDLSDKLLGIELTNSVPVRGVQFTLEGVKMTEVRTTAHTKGFLVDFNSESGVVIIISTSGDKIKAGKGQITEVLYEMGGTANLSKIKIVK